MTIFETAVFSRWFRKLKDPQATARIVLRLLRVQQGNLGDVKLVGEGVSELRIDHGPGYRLYIARRGDDLVILLCGGDKKTQTADIERAKALARDPKELNEWR